MKRIAVLLFTGSLWTSVSHAEWAGDFNGCAVELPHPARYVIWDGACKGGKATGTGIARSANGTRIEGEFRKGSPYTATGQFMVETDGKRSMIRVTYVRGKPTFSPLVNLPGRTRTELSPIVGYWDWQNAEGKCKEKHEYRLNGDMVVLDGDLRVNHLAQLFTVDGNPGWLELVTTSIGHNGQSDCHGNKLDHVGDTEMVYLHIDNEQKLWRCTAADEMTCTAVAARGVADPPKERNLITSAAGRSSGSITTANPNRQYGIGKVPGSLAQTSGEKIELVFDRSKGALYALYGRALRDNPKLQGKIVFEIDIDVTGRVASCRVKSSELGDPKLEKEMCTRISLIQFGTLDAPVTITRPIDFFPAK